MSTNIPNNGKWIEQLSKDYKIPKDVQIILSEKFEYGNRLTAVLEDIKTAALGIDPQSKLELRILEKKVIDVLRKTNAEIKKIVAQHKDLFNENMRQGKLFDV